MHAYKSFKSIKSERERAPYQNQGPNNLCKLLRSLPNGTFVHSLQNIAFRSYRRAERDKARHTFTGNVFTMYSRARRQRMHGAAERLEGGSDETLTGEIVSFSIQTFHFFKTHPGLASTLYQPHQNFKMKIQSNTDIIRDDEAN